MNFMIYIIKVNIAIAVFYCFYKLLFRKDTFFQIKRFMLNTSLIFAFVFPFIQFSSWFNSQPTVQANVTLVRFAEAIVETRETLQMQSEDVGYRFITIVYIMGVIVLAIYFIIKLTQLLLKIANCKPIEIKGQKISMLEGCQTPFSFFNRIFIDPTNHTPEELNEILKHEQTHVNQWHSIDVLIYEFVCIFCWFNPLAWLIKLESRINLEYLADNSVISSGCDTKHYQLCILQLSYNKAIASLTNNFNLSPLKKRISMMNREKTKRTGLLKYILFVPLILGLVYGNSLNANEYAKGIINVETNSQQSDEICLNPETMPEYPGGEDALLRYLRENVKYPVKAYENRKTGRIQCNFIITKTGEIDNITIEKSIDPALEKEAIRVVKGMSKWTSGKYKGESVNVQYSLLFSFSLLDGEKTIGPEPNESNIKEITIEIGRAHV